MRICLTHGPGPHGDDHVPVCFSGSRTSARVAPVKVFFTLLLPPALLILLILAPRRNGQAAGPGSRALAVFIGCWAVVAIVLSMFWERWGLALVWKATSGE